MSKVTFVEQFVYFLISKLSEKSLNKHQFSWQWSFKPCCFEINKAFAFPINLLKTIQFSHKQKKIICWAEVIWYDMKAKVRSILESIGRRIWNYCRLVRTTDAKQISHCMRRPGWVWKKSPPKTGLAIWKRNNQWLFKPNLKILAMPKIDLYKTKWKISVWAV